MTSIFLIVTADEDARGAYDLPHAAFTTRELAEQHRQVLQRRRTNVYGGAYEIVEMPLQRIEPKLTHAYYLSAHLTHDEPLPTEPQVNEMFEYETTEPSTATVHLGATGLIIVRIVTWSREEFASVRADMAEQVERLRSQAAEQAERVAVARAR